MLMSATSSAEVEQLQQLVLHNPVTLNLLAAGNGPAAAAAGAAGSDAAAAAADGAAGFGDGGAGSAAEIAHFSFSCSRDDRRLVVLSLLKLGLLRKKVRGTALIGKVLKQEVAYQKAMVNWLDGCWQQ
jgi:ATP-dependent RNA helicase DDX56/DBP9